MRFSKYLNFKSGPWTCIHVGVATVTPAFKAGTKIRNKSAGHRQYYYIFERPTSDGKAMKMVRLNAQQANLVLNGYRTVEGYAKKKKRERSTAFKQKVSYSFCD